MAYPGFAYSFTHPARLEVLGILFGLRPAPATSARVLELGCGDAVNLLSMAQALPGASFVGVDASERAIERGATLARAAGLDNVELRVASLEALPDDLGEADYLVSHGVYSWVSPRARGGLLDCAQRRLSDHGLAYVSYNAYPGCHLRDMTREILRHHLRAIDDPELALEQAHRLMETIVAIDDPNPYARALREQMERMLQFSDALLFHDDLAEISTPFYFHEFIEHAAAHGLQFLSEADLAESRMEGVPATAQHLFTQLTDDPLAREQYMDFFRNRSFRRTVLCRTERVVRRAIDDVHLERFTISCSARPAPAGDDAEPMRTFATPEGVSVSTSERLVLGALAALSARWPAGLTFGELLQQAAAVSGEAPAAAAPRLRAFLLEAFTARALSLQTVPAPVSPSAGGRPHASALGRAQAAAGMPTVSSLLHANARLEGTLEQRLLELLDGTRDRAALRAQLCDGGEAGEIDTALARFASLGLLHA